MIDIRNKPLVLLQNPSTETVRQLTDYKPGEDVEELFLQSPTCEDYLDKLTSNPKLHKDAAFFLAHALEKRARVWWGYLCVKTVIDELKGPAPEVKMPKSEQDQADDDLLAKLKGLKPDDLKPPPVSIEGVNCSDPSSWPDPHLDSSGRFVYLPEPFQSAPGRRKLGIELFYEREANRIAKMTPEQLENYRNAQQQVAVLFQETHGMDMQAYAQKLVDEQASITPPFDIPQQASPFDDFKKNLKKMDGVMDRKMAAMQKQLKEAQKSIPARKERPKLTSQTAQKAFAATFDWLAIPEEQNGKLAFDLGRKCKKDQACIGLLAQATLWSGNNLTPGKDNIVVPPPGLAPLGVFGAVFKAAYVKGSIPPPQRLHNFLQLGVEIAQGLRSWEDEIIPRPSVDPWEGKAGFGRS